jgi:hypothetical protein
MELLLRNERDGYTWGIDGVRMIKKQQRGVVLEKIDV